jgi:hypothetical protein
MKLEFSGSRLRCRCGSTVLFAVAPGAEPTNVVMIADSKIERARLRRGRPARAWCRECWLQKHTRAER